MNAKYKVGDKVRIREDLVVDENYGLGFVPSMAQYKGKVATITDIQWGIVILSTSMMNIGIGQT